MNAFVALFRRELAARWQAIAASSLMGLFVALFAFFLAPATTSPAEFRGIASAVVLVSWSALLAILVGASLFSREIAGGAFAFRLPVPGFSHWAARLTAALALLLLSTLALLSPSLAFGMDFEAFRVALASPLPASELGAPVPLAKLLVLAWILVLALSNAFALALRTRNAWSTLDLVSAVLLALAIFSGWRTLQAVDAPAALWLTKGATALLLLPGLLLAGFRQISIGRGEADRAQRAHSIVLVIAAALAAAGTVGLARWYANPTLDDLSAENAIVEPIGGNRAIVKGPVVDRVRMRAYFLLDLASGESHRLPLRPGKSPVARARGSADGSRFGWFETDWSERTPHSELVLFDAANPGVAGITAITAAPRPTDWALSPSANRVAVADRRSRPAALGVVVYQVSPPATLRSLAFDSCDFAPTLWFLSESRLEVECRSREVPPGADTNRIWKHEIDLETGEIAARASPLMPPSPGETVTLPGDQVWRTVQRCSVRPCRLVAREGRAAYLSLGLFDEATGKVREFENQFTMWRNDADRSGIVLLHDSSGRWTRFDPATGELLPVFDEALYVQSGRLYGW